MLKWAEHDNSIVGSLRLVRSAPGLARRALPRRIRRTAAKLPFHDFTARGIGSDCLTLPDVEAIDPVRAMSTTNLVIPPEHDLRRACALSQNREPAQTRPRDLPMLDEGRPIAIILEQAVQDAVRDRILWDQGADTRYHVNYVGTGRELDH
jgi:hypothetical protein